MTGIVISNQNICKEYYKLRILYPDPLEGIIPGQFFMLQVNKTYDPLLRRPFSFHKVSKPEKSIFSKFIAVLREANDYSVVEFLYKVVGKGTEIISHIPPKTEIDILGPYGNGFKLEPSTKIFLLLAGGIGIAPLFALTEEIRHNKLYQKAKIVFLVAGKEKGDILCLKDLKNRGINIKRQVKVKTCTEDGSLGEMGLIDTLCQDVLKSISPSSNFQDIQMLACGPLGMLAKIAKISIEHNIPCQVSLDKAMACGIGVCQGCAIKVKDTNENNKFIYKHVCKDGPVFDAREVVW